MTQLSEVTADGVKDSQQDVDVGGVKLCRVGRMSVLGEDLVQLTCTQELFKKKQTLLISGAASVLNSRCEASEQNHRYDVARLAEHLSSWGRGPSYLCCSRGNGAGGARSSRCWV